MTRVPKKILRHCTNKNPKGEGDWDDQLDPWGEDKDDLDDENAPNCDCHSQGTGCPHNRTEIIVDDHLTLPLAKPDMDEILRCLAKPVITHWDLLESQGQIKAIISGTVEVRTEYVAASSENSVHVATFKIPFHTMLTSCRRIKQVTVKPLYRYGELVNQRSLSFVVVLAIMAV